VRVSVARLSIQGDPVMRCSSVCTCIGEVPLLGGR
jgi:hypothetical protein